MSKRADGLIKISELARLSGVPVPTIKYYISKRLIAGPALKTSRNMAWYDPAEAPRIRAIRELQRTQFLPLDVIREMLDGGGGFFSENEVVDSVARAVRGRVSERKLSREALLRTGVDDEDLDWLVMQGLVTPVRVDGTEYWEGDDLMLAETVASARRAGLSAEMLPLEVLQRYEEVVQQLVRLEVELFSRGIVPRAGNSLGPLADEAVEHSERLIRILRRKHLVPMLRTAIPETKK